MIHSLNLKNSIQDKVQNLTIFDASLDSHNARDQRFHTHISKPKQTVWQFVWSLLHKKPTFYLLIFSGLLFFLPFDHALAASVGQTQTFSSTAYYSPLPGQMNYYRGSYAADIALNGNGTHGADGTEVFVGMIAAPRGYDFGTKIQLDGIGVVSVHDRGGAILKGKNGESHDRIDIWMGYGDVGLARTIAWGRRDITGTIVAKNTPVQVNLDAFESIPRTQKSQRTHHTQVQKTDAVLSRFRALGYTPANSSEQARKAMILQFQIDHQVISGPDAYGAGYYGPKTTAALRKAYANRTQKKDTKPRKQETKKSQKIHSQAMTYDEANQRSMSMRTVGIGKQADTIVNLQTFLMKTGFYSGKIDGIMSLKLLGSLRAYQHSRGTIQTGRVDIRTQGYIIKDLMKKST